MSRFSHGNGTKRTHFTKSVWPRKRRPRARVVRSQDQMVLSQQPAKMVEGETVREVNGERGPRKTWELLPV